MDHNFCDSVAWRLLLAHRSVSRREIRETNEENKKMVVRTVVAVRSFDDVYRLGSGCVVNGRREKRK